MTNERSMEGSQPGGPEGYPIESALRAIDHFSYGKEGEPQLITFGEPLRHYTWMDVGGGESLTVEGQTISLPNRKPLFVGEYGSIEEMVGDLREKAKVDEELFEQRKQQKIDSGELFEMDLGPKPLPLTTAEEAERESFEANCLDLEEIREAAQDRADMSSEGEMPRLTVVNLDSGNEQELVMDAAALIAKGALYITRGRSPAYGQSDMTVKTGIELGQLLKEAVSEIGIDPESVAVLGERDGEDILYSADGIFKGQTEISGDNWSADGQYSKASDKPTIDSPSPRHSLYDGSWHRIDSYDAEDFLDAAQAVTSRYADFARRLSTGGKLKLQPLEPLDVAFHALRRGVENAGFEFGYAINTVTVPRQTYLMAVKPNGRVEKHLIFSDDEDYGLTVANAMMEFKRWRKVQS